MPPTHTHTALITTLTMSLADAAEAMMDRIRSGPTTRAMKRLIADLEPYKDVRGVKAMIKTASQNHYDDFESPLSFPKLELAVKCEKMGLHTIAKNTTEGKYD